MANLIFWAKSGSKEEENIIKAAEAAGIEPKKAARILDEIFKNYRDAATRKSLPEIKIGGYLTLRPSRRKIMWQTCLFGIKRRLGIISDLNFIVKVTPLHWVLRRLIDNEKLSYNDRNKTALEWKNIIEPTINSMIKVAKEEKPEDFLVKENYALQEYNRMKKELFLTRVEFSKWRTKQIYPNWTPKERG